MFLLSWYVVEILVRGLVVMQFVQKVCRMIRALSPSATKQASQLLAEKGFVHLRQVLAQDLVTRLKSRFPPLFRGEFDTGVYPDE
jgi:hypothetical protein